MKLSQSGGRTLRHKVPLLGSLEYKPSQLGVQAKRLEAQATWSPSHRLRDALDLKAQSHRLRDGLSHKQDRIDV
jgi:hypothetical protein